MALNKKGNWHMYLDFWALNKLNIKVKCPISVIDDLLDELHGANFFTKFDLHSIYHQTKMKEVDSPKISFCTHEGHYEFVMMPFVLFKVQSTLQSLMKKIF